MRRRPKRLGASSERVEPVPAPAAAIFRFLSMEAEPIGNRITIRARLRG